MDKVFLRKKLLYKLYINLNRKLISPSSKISFQNGLKRL